MRKQQPGGERVLCLESLGSAGGEFDSGQAVDGMSVRYSMETTGELEILDDVQWADWDRDGRLLVATRSGKLQIRIFGSHGLEIAFEEDLTQHAPSPTPAPAWARHW